MSHSHVIIRLQGLPWSADALAIRKFFQNLNIPDGGVHIVGGEKGDSFIAFVSDDDARQAMMRTGGTINNVAVQLMLSSRAEMQQVIAAARGDPPISQQDSRSFNPDAPPPSYNDSRRLGHGGDAQNQRMPPHSQAEDSSERRTSFGVELRNAPGSFAPTQNEPMRNGSYGGRGDDRVGYDSRDRESNRSRFDHRDVVDRRDPEPVRRDDFGGPPPRHMGQHLASGGLSGSVPGGVRLGGPADGFGYGGGPAPIIDQRRDFGGGIGFGAAVPAHMDPMIRGDRGPPPFVGVGDSFRSRSPIRQESTPPPKMVEIRDLPNDVRYRDIRAFLKGCDVAFKGTRMSKDGKIAVKFNDQRSYENALRLNNSKFMGRMIWVGPCSERFWADIDDLSEGRVDLNALNVAKMSDLGRPGQVMNCCVVAGLPQSFDKITATRMVSALPGYIPGSLFVETDNFGRCTGRCYIEFVDPNSVDTAIRTGVFNPYNAVPITMKQMRDAIQSLSGSAPPPVRPLNDAPPPRRVPLSRPRSPPRRGDVQNCVVVSNLPLSCEGKDVEKFCEKFKVARRGIFVRYSNAHESMGDAFVEFVSKDEANRFIEEMNGETCLGNSVETTPMTRTEMTDRINRHTREKREDREARGHPTQSKEGKDAVARLNAEGPFTVVVKNLSYRLNDRDFDRFSKGYNVSSYEFLKTNEGRFSGEALANFENIHDMRLAVAEWTGQLLLGREVRLEQKKSS